MDKNLKKMKFNNKHNLPISDKKIEKESPEATLQSAPSFMFEGKSVSGWKPE